MLLNNENRLEELPAIADAPTETKTGETTAVSESSVTRGLTLSDLDTATLSLAALDALDIPPEKPIIGDWFAEADSDYIFAPRGLGKTWFALHMAIAISEGGKFADWQAHKKRVLYVDGEMPIGKIRHRIQSLRRDTSAKIPMHLLSHQSVFDTTGKNLNLSDNESQTALTRYCEKLTWFFSTISRRFFPA